MQGQVLRDQIQSFQDLILIVCSGFDKVISLFHS
jgi:hypothetical protein